MQDFLESTNFTSIFIGLVVLKFLLETYLKVRNLKSIELNKDAIPERFVSVVTDEEYKKSIDYNVDRIRFQIFTALFGVVVLIIFTFVLFRTFETPSEITRSPSFIPERTETFPKFLFPILISLFSAVLFFTI